MRREEKGNSIILTCTREELMEVENVLRKARGLSTEDKDTPALTELHDSLGAIRNHTYTSIKFNVTN